MNYRRTPGNPTSGNETSYRTEDTSSPSVIEIRENTYLTYLRKHSQVGETYATPALIIFSSVM